MNLQLKSNYGIHMYTEQGGVKWKLENGERKKFVRYKEGAQLYSICQSKFEKMAKEAKAIYKVDKVVLVNCELFEKYLESFHLEW